MKLRYQVATPDMAIADSAAAYQESLEESFRNLGRLGYDGVEPMTLNPEKLNWNEVKEIAEKNGLSAILVCTGRILGQLGLSYINPREETRKEAIRRSREIVDFIGFLGANISIGRVRGQYCGEPSREETENLAMEAFRGLADYGVPRNVNTTLETVTITQTDFIDALTEGAAMMDRVDHPNFRLMMDIFHLSLEEEDIYEVIHRCSSYNIHVYLADNNRRYPGHCDLDFGKILTAFEGCRYDDNFCIETFQILSMEEVAVGAIRHLWPITDRAYGRTA